MHILLVIITMEMKSKVTNMFLVDLECRFIFLILLLPFFVYNVRTSLMHIHGDELPKPNMSEIEDVYSELDIRIIYIKEVFKHRHLRVQKWKYSVLKISIGHHNA